MKSSSKSKPNISSNGGHSSSLGYSSNTTWTALQDALLLDAVEKRQKNWNLVSENVFGKSWLECKSRYDELKGRLSSLSSPNPADEKSSTLLASRTAAGFSSSSSINSNSPQKRTFNQNVKASTMLKVKRSPAAIRVAQKIMQARSNASPGKLNKGVSPVRQSAAAPSLVYGSPLKLKLFHKTPTDKISKSIAATNPPPPNTAELFSKVPANRSPPKFNWQVKASNHGPRQYADSSPTIATHYPVSFSPFLDSKGPSDPTVSKLKKSNYDSRSSPAIPFSRDSPFQSAEFVTQPKKKVSPLNPASRKVSPHKFTYKSPGSISKVTRPSPSSLLKARSIFFNNPDKSPSKSSLVSATGAPKKNIPHAARQQLHQAQKKVVQSPARLRDITRSPKVSSPLRFENKKTLGVTPNKPAKAVRTGRNWGASPAKYLSSALDYHPKENDTLQKTGGEKSDEAQEASQNFDQFLKFDFVDNNNIDENGMEIDPYLKEIIPAPLDQGMLESFLSPPPPQRVHHCNIPAAAVEEGNSKFWNDLFTSEGQFGGLQSDLYDVAHSAPAQFGGDFNMMLSEGVNAHGGDDFFSFLGVDDEFGAKESESAGKANLQSYSQKHAILPSTLDPEVEIPRDEVDDLFKDAAQENGYSNVLQKQNLHPGKKKGINWLVNSNEGFSVEQVATLRKQIFQSFQLSTQLGALEREATGNSGFWESQMNMMCNMKKQGIKAVGAKSVFNIPGLELSAQIQSCFASNPDPLFEKKYISGGGKNKMDLPSSVSNLLNLFSSYFNPSMLPNLKPSSKSNKGATFSASEDALLLHGLVTFGENDPQSIQSHCLPGRSVNQVSYRIRNLTKRTKGESSAVKDFMLLPFKPMNYNEKYILRQGVLKYGINFKKVAPLIFPHIPSPLLETAWTELFKIGQIPFAWNHLEMANKKAAKGAKSKQASSRASTGKHSSHNATNRSHLLLQTEPIPLLHRPILTARAPLIASQESSAASNAAFASGALSVGVAVANASMHNSSSIPLPKRLVAVNSGGAGGHNDSSHQNHSDFENNNTVRTRLEEDDDHTLLEGLIVASPIPEPLMSNTNPVRGAGRGAHPARKKRGRIDKDVIDTTVSIKKLRRIVPSIRKSDGHEMEKVSKLHAILYQHRDHSWSLCDKNSRNGTYVNRVRLGSDNLWELFDKDEIWIADVRCKFRMTGDRVWLEIHDIGGGSVSSEELDLATFNRPHHIMSRRYSAALSISSASSCDDEPFFVPELETGNFADLAIR